MQQTFATLITAAVSNVMREQIRSIVAAINGRRQEPVLETVAETLRNDLPYFNTWYTQEAIGTVDSIGKGLQLWAEQNEVNLVGLGIVIVKEERKSPPPKPIVTVVIQRDEMHRQMMDAARTYFRDPKNEGLIADVYSIADVLVQQFEPFAQWRQAQIDGGHPMNPGEALVKWFQQNVAANFDLYKEYGIYVPEPRLSKANWVRNRPAQVITRKQLNSEREYEEFQGRLTSLIWFDAVFNDDEKMSLASQAKHPSAASAQQATAYWTDEAKRLYAGSVKNFGRGTAPYSLMRQARKKIAEIRYLLDSADATYLLPEQVQFVYDVTNTVFPVANFTDMIRRKQNDPTIRGMLYTSKLMITVMTRGQGTNTIDTLFATILQSAAQSNITTLVWKRKTLVNLPIDLTLRNPDARRIARISHLIKRRNFRRLAIEQPRSFFLKSFEMLTRPFMKFQTASGGVITPEVDLTFENVARYLRLVGDRDEIVRNGENLKQWFQSEKIKGWGVTPEFYGIKDNALTADVTAATTDVGGIDLNPDVLDLQVIRDKKGVALPVAEQPLQTINIDGFIPVIINIVPANMPMLLGLQDQNHPPSSAQKDDNQNAPDREIQKQDRFPSREIPEMSSLVN